MSTRYLVALLPLAALIAPAGAAEFYIVQDTATKRCHIVDQKPTSITMVVVGDSRAFETRPDAENAMKSVEVCRSGDMGPGGQTTQQPK
jgi:acetolactate synthase small subunit